MNDDDMVKQYFKKIFLEVEVRNKHKIYKSAPLAICNAYRNRFISYIYFACFLHPMDFFHFFVLFVFLSSLSHF